VNCGSSFVSAYALGFGVIKTGLKVVNTTCNINKYLSYIIAAILLLLAPLGALAQQREETPQRERIQMALADISVKQLPPEARDTISLIEKNGPYPHDRDGIVFGNFEKRLPVKERGYYNEFTVKTPGVKHRGARRIVTGKGGEKYYSDDHYKTFKRIVP
jgi:ribonuclease T1